MPTLNWIGKEAVVNHDQTVPYRLIHCNGDLSVGEAGEGNLLVEGDNLHALKALLPYYRKQVKCIYIDPPYNTGNEGWVYNDAVNSPEIKKWLGEAVGGEAEDLSRHDKWLCMMYPRLKLLVQFLRQDGFLFVSLDEIEIANFRLMMEEILPRDKYISTLIWKSRRNLDNRSLHNVSIDHEYVAAYRMADGAFRGTDKDMSKYSNPDNDPRGPWMSDNLVGLATKERRPNLHYVLVNPETGDSYPPPQKGWRYSQETMGQKIKEGRIMWPARKTGRPRHKKFLTDLQSEFAGFSSFVESGNTNEGTEEVSRIMGGEQFIFPKPRSLIQILLRQTTSSDDIVLDAFAGTGTTGHAVLALNNEDGGNRRFILIEMEPEICRKITAERLRRVIEPHPPSAVASPDDEEQRRRQERGGLGGGFRYCTLGEPLFDERGQIREKVKFGDLARHIFFTETGEPLPRRVTGRTPFVGELNSAAYYLLWGEAGSVLNLKALKSLKAHTGPKVIYADACRLSPAQLQARGIVFKQIPYEVKAG